MAAPIVFALIMVSVVAIGVLAVRRTADPSRENDRDFAGRKLFQPPRGRGGRSSGGLEGFVPDSWSDGGGDSWYDDGDCGDSGHGDGGCSSH